MKKNEKKSTSSFLSISKLIQKPLVNLFTNELKALYLRAIFKKIENQRERNSIDSSNQCILIFDGT